MAKLDAIKELKEHYINNLYNKVRTEQKTDQGYIDDTFLVEEVREPHVPVRSGFGSRMVNAPAEQIITSNPQAFIKVLKGKAEAGERIAKVINQQWLPRLSRLNPNPFKEYVKDLLGRGEAYIQVVHNANWVTGGRVRRGLPVLFLIHDPMVIYGSPEEDDNGVPERVLVFYERQYKDVILRYPDFTNPKGAGIGDNKDLRVSWFEYWDKNDRYFEADSEPILQGSVQKNIYGLVPFARKYSGFGRRSPEGKLEDLIVSDIKMTRDLIKEECIKRSNIASIENIFAHRPRTIIYDGEINEEQVREFNWGAYDLNILQNVDPAKIKIDIDEQVTPPPEMYMSLATIRSELNQRNPFIMAGFPQGASGRQQDLSSMSAMRRYDTVIENTQNAFATAIEMAFQILKRVPTLVDGIEGWQKDDLDVIFECEVKLRAEDPIEEDRKATLGDRLWMQGNGAIDLETFHTEFLGYTQDESKEIKAAMLVDKLTLFNPDVAQVMGMIFAEEAGMDKYIEEAQKRSMMMQEQQKGLQKAPPATTQERIGGEAKTPLGKEMMDTALGSKGSRRPPQRYTRS